MLRLATTALVLLALGACATRGGEAPPPATQGAGGGPLRLVVPSKDRKLIYQYRPFATPPQPPSPRDVPVGEQAIGAYDAALRRMFGHQGQLQLSAELHLSISEADITTDRDGFWFAFVEHDLVLRTTGGEEIARWHVRGEGRFSGLGEQAVPRAFEEAAAYAAAAFEANFETRAPAAAWRRSLGQP